MAKKEEPKVEPGVTAKELGTLWAQLGAMLRANNKATVEAAQNTAAVVKEGQTKSKGLFKSLLGGFGALFKKSGSKEKEKENEERRFRKMMLRPLIAMKEGLKNMAKSAKEKAKKAMGSLKDMVIKGAMMLGVAALLAFVNSPLFDKLKTWVMDKLLPGMKKVVDIVVNIAKTITEWVSVAVDWIVLAFTDPLAVLNKLWGGMSSIGQFIWDTVISPAWTWITTLFTDPVAALKQLVMGYGSLVDWIFRNTFMKAWNWITGLFGFEPIASTFSLWDTISAVFDEVKGWFIGLFTWGRKLGTTKDGIWSLSTMIDNAFTLVKDWVIGLFTWTRAAGTTADGKWSLATMIDAAFLKVKAWAVSLFTWLLAPEGTSWIQTTVKAAVDLVKKWATSLFTWSSTDNPDEAWLTTKVKEAINLVKDWVIGLFSWVSTAGLVDGKKWSLSTMIDAAVNKVISWVKSLFLWSTAPVGPDDSWIKTTINAVITKVKDWAKSLFAWAELPGDSWISQKVKDIIITVKAWVVSLFSWASTEGQVDGKAWSVITLVQEIITKAIGWVKSLFSWATTDEVTDPKEWSILGTVKAVIASAIGWVVSLFTWASKAGEVDGEKWSLSKMIKDAVDLVIGWVKGLFNWVVGGPAVLWTGLVGFVTGAFDGVVKWFTGLFSWGVTDETAADPDGFSLTTLISGVFTSIKEWFGKLFKFDSASSVIASIVNVLTFIPNLLKDMFTGVTTWLLDIFGFGDASKKLANATDWSIGSLVVGAFKAVKDWIVGLFSWGDTDETTAEGKDGFSLFGIISGVFTGIKKWFVGLFSWGDTDEAQVPKFSLLSLIITAISGIGDWFKSLFDIDWSTAIKDLAPDWIKKVPIIGKWFGGDDEKNKQAAKTETGLQATQEAAAQGGEQFKTAQASNYEEATAARAGLGDEERADAMQGMGFFKRDTMSTWGAQLDVDKLGELVVAGMITSEDIDALLAEGNVEFSKDQKASIKSIQDVIKKRQAKDAATLKAEGEYYQKGTTSGSIFVHDAGVHERLDLISKGFDFATNSAKLASASAGVADVGGNTTNVTPVVINAPTQSSIANTKVEASIGLNDPFTHLERAY